MTIDIGKSRPRGSSPAACPAGVPEADNRTEIISPANKQYKDRGAAIPIAPRRVEKKEQRAELYFSTGYALLNNEQALLFLVDNEKIILLNFVH